MCGRYTAHWSEAEFRESFKVQQPLNLLANYNISPTTQVVIVRQQEEIREAAYASWGLIPHWVKDYRNFKPLFNARSETVHEKPAFKDSFKKRRCLIPASGFYEWKDKKPNYFQVLDCSVFAFAGFWSSSSYNGETLESCTILTTVPNELMSKFHHRMPVILQPENYTLWLDSSKKEFAELEHLFTSFSAEHMISYSVARDVNNSRNNSPDLIKALA